MDVVAGGRLLGGIGMFVAFFSEEKGSRTNDIKYPPSWNSFAGLGAGLLAAPAILRAEGQPIVIRAGRTEN